MFESTYIMIIYDIHSDAGKSMILWLMCMEIAECLYKSEVIPRDFPQDLGSIVGEGRCRQSAW